MKKLQKLLLIMALFVGFVAPTQAYAQEDPPPPPPGSSGRDEACSALGGSNCDNGGAEVSNVVATAINILSAVGGVIALITVILGGIRYITSGGDAANITSAKNTIIYALIGLIVIAFAQVLVQFVLERT